MRTPRFCPQATNLIPGGAQERLGSSFLNRTGLFLTGLLVLAGILSYNSPSLGQPARNLAKPLNGGGQALQGAVKVPFEPAVRDAQGRVIEVVPEAYLGINPSAEHLSTSHAEAEKALADSHKAPPITKTAPRLLVPGQVPELPQPIPKAETHVPRTSSPDIPEQAPLPDEPSGSNFPGITFDAKIPPDVAMAAGPNQIVTSTNVVVNTFDKVGNVLGTSFFGKFFKSLV